MLEVRIAICLITLIVASIMDLKKREISDKVWIISSSFSLILFILEFKNIDIIAYIISLTITSSISYSIYKFGLFGGADAKALIVISSLLPYYDTGIHNISALTVLTNSVILTVGNIIYNVIKNSIDIIKGRNIFQGFNEPLSRKIFAFMLGNRVYKVNGFAFLMEEKNGKERRFRFHAHAYDEFANANDVWVTYAIPFIVYITIGFVIMILYGDIIWKIIEFVIYKGL
ncbi:MAG: A24 family peptidase C-terminal domain-containing protein [Candidatus Nitrosocaldaceae archaeon]